ncbi:MAG: FtsW/RodA/SpoVE family cell cycle protein [Paenibacillaceae bacterium]|uniref:FtsW/RodA/SpoVE family cell cycle protein n=1 Tax=Paenibacillus mellifer TaxID=2937794 RepID=A0A9X1Y3E3_9BACL|nr:FtsW/RodA/SpoVE family cell cycle protein [Paenibacillus mellifer]MBW4838375.1 FtsW/RodA/SpoVE family cell cycle protein [Paenibacillaceae bacterium]MCK8488891.1 FtsW/RodA/SpoVE family cell cycle protein [Paenibacillus mellifer]
MFFKIRKVDWLMVGILALFMLFSTLLVRSAIAPYETEFQGYDVKTIIFYLLGFVVVFGMALVDYRTLLRYSWFVYGAGCMLLVMVYLFAPEINGARSWFRIGGLQFQPAELVKVILILTSGYLLGKKMGQPLQFRRDIIPITLVTLLPFVLVLIQPDLGNAIIYLVVLVGMLWIGNARYSHVLIALTAAVAALILFVTLFNAYNTQIQDYLEKHQKLHWYQRINTFINPDQASSDDRHQSNYAKIAIGSGGLLGDGYMKGDLKNKKFVPYPYSDSIFVVVGEEFGFIGASVLLLLYFLFIYRMILIALHCIDKRGAYIIVGIVAMFLFQIFENVGMMIGLMPITGITLPFISYGGTSLLINMLCIGLVFSIKLHQEKYKVE